ncbi:hypothetical protein EYC98_19825 [Halieaceae bacterium IMCC14734]|uniref:DUF4760 domain-containing protein n=1 Tax=Candidatus Litorirhabdus singularis TaxID=2518993 RepID=A0ABT3TP74_9GAMM|nr:hypothetical protein [Candidatus Litorirhabdus singularis]MCX2983117.1 hypothetical protein [Candidatus Litorirhabdus singularis]
MTLEDLGNIGDFLGGIGVVLTLLYLALQIRQNTKQLKADTLAAETIAIEGTTSDIARWIGEIVENRDLAELWSRGLLDIDQLDETDRLRFDYLGVQLLQAWQTVFRRCKQVDDPDLWVMTLRYFKMYFRNPGFQSLWASSRMLLVPDFVAAIEEAVVKPKSRLTSQGSEDAVTGAPA